MPPAPGVIRDSIFNFLCAAGRDASADEILTAVRSELSGVSPSSVQSNLILNIPDTFERTARGRYRLNGTQTSGQAAGYVATTEVGQARLYHADCFAWLAKQASASVHAIVSDPPYGLIEYTDKETSKLRAGRGGVWRIPPSFDGHQRAPLPRFTVLSDEDRRQLFLFFKRLGLLVARVAVPGANVVIASNPLLAHIVVTAMAEAGLEPRGYISRQVMTLRGGDRPKNAHHEFDGVSVMPRSQWEPWVVMRTPLDGRVQDNLRRWGTGGFRRPSAERPFGDLIASGPTPPAERRIAPHPSLKPQAFMRQIVRAALPLGKGIVVDPFMGAGSTLAAANAVGYDSVGIEVDEKFYDMATKAVQRLAELPAVCTGLAVSS